MSFKAAFIGAGSLGFTRTLLADLLAVPEFRDMEVAFTDIDRQNLNLVYKLCRRDMEHNRVPAKLTATLNRREALRGARYVFNTARVGGLEGFKLDIEIPLKYGIDQCVGDTLCVGGIMYGQRGIPAVLDFCKDIREVAHPDCLFMNYGNPNAMLTWAAGRYGQVRAIGLCHGVEGGWNQIVEALGLYHGDLKTPVDKAECRKLKKEVNIIAAGINHQTWYVRVLYKGRPVAGKEMLAAFEAHPVYSRTEKVRIDILRRFGCYSTESNGHLSEYVAWYRKRPNEIRKWIDLGSWINGETGGYLRVCMEGRNWFEKEFRQVMSAPPKVYGPETRGHEHGSYIVEGLETGRTYRGHFNVVNNGCIPNLPADAIVEVPGYVDRNGINIPRVGDLPPGCAAVCNASISVQRLAVHAAVRGDDVLLRQAMMMDPLTGAVCNPPEIWQLADEMLVAQARWLPQYRKAVREARKRLARGIPIKTRAGYLGAARRKVPAAGRRKKAGAKER